MTKPSRVCVIGAGPQGLVALKSLLELNDDKSAVFDAEILEARDAIGGAWRFSEDPAEVTALPGTVQNTSKYRNCYSDFPVADAWKEGGREGSAPRYLSAEETVFYMEMYAKRFGLMGRIKLGWRVLGLGRDEEKGMWRVDCLHAKSGEKKTELYDKVIVATGQHHGPVRPTIEGIENFKGEVLHSIQFKSAAPFKDKAVLVLGSSNSAGDICTDLSATAKTVLLSHRRGVTIVPRFSSLTPVEIVLSKRVTDIVDAVTALAPAYMTLQVANLGKNRIAALWRDRLKPEWRLSPETSPCMLFTPPMVSDTMVPLLEAAKVTSVPGLQRILPDGTLELQGGETVQADAIVYATGYDAESVLAGPVERSGKFELPRLFQNIYHPDYPTSLAYLTFWHTAAGICEVADLASMGIAQVFSERYALPPRATMERQIDTNQKFVEAFAARATQPIGLKSAQLTVDRGPFIKFLHEVAGTRVYDKLGFGLEGWRFWWSERELCSMLMTGINSSHSFRLFEGRPGSRAKWDGARQAIADANEVLWAEERENAKLRAKEKEEDARKKKNSK